MLRVFLLASTAATIARTPSGGRITFEVIDLLASRVDDPHRRVAVNMDPTAISDGNGPPYGRPPRKRRRE